MRRGMCPGCDSGAGGGTAACNKPSAAAVPPPASVRPPRFIDVRALAAHRERGRQCAAKCVGLCGDLHRPPRRRYT